MQQAGRDTGDEIRVRHEFRREVVFAAEGVACVPRGAEAHLAERDFDARGRFLGEGGEGGGGPVSDVLLRLRGLRGVVVALAFEGGDDGFDAGGLEAAVDRHADVPGEEGRRGGREARVEFLDGAGDGQQAGAQVGVVLEDELAEAGGEVGEHGGVDVVGRNAGVEGLDALEGGGGEGEIGAEAALEAREEKGAADVGEEADAGFGHGEDGVFGGDADGGVNGETDAAAHGDAVEVGDVGFRVGGNEVVELVLEAEVMFRVCAAGVAVLGDGGCQMGDVAAGAECFGAGAANDDDRGEGGFLVFLCGCLEEACDRG